MKIQTMLTPAYCLAAIFLHGCSHQVANLWVVDEPPLITASSTCSTETRNAPGQHVTQKQALPADWQALIEHLKQSPKLNVQFDGNDGAILVSLVEEKTPKLFLRLVGTTGGNSLAVECRTETLKELVGDVYYKASRFGRFTHVSTVMLAEDETVNELSSLVSAVCDTGICPPKSGSKSPGGMLNNTHRAAQQLTKKGHGIYFMAYSTTDSKSILGIEIYDESRFLIWIYFLRNPAALGSATLTQP
jgi:hypothetical protein